MPENDAADIIARMRQAAAERPDFVYSTPESPAWAQSEGCVYFAGGDTNCPSCLVGIGIAPILTPDDFVDDKMYLGDDDDPVQVHRFYNEGQDAGQVLADLVDAGRLVFSHPRQKGWIKAAQEHQDTKVHPWAECIAHADRVATLPDPPRPPQAESAGV